MPVFVEGSVVYNQNMTHPYFRELETGEICSAHCRDTLGQPWLVTWSDFDYCYFSLLWNASKVKHVVLGWNRMARTVYLWVRLSMTVKFHGIPNYALDH